MVAIPMPRRMNICNCYHINCYAMQSGKFSATFLNKTVFSSSALTTDVLCLSEVLVVRNHPTRRHIPLQSEGHICLHQNFKHCKFLIVLNTVKLWNTKLKFLHSACKLLLEYHCCIRSFFRLGSLVLLIRVATR
jgi:hypothetical protein